MIRLRMVKSDDSELCLGHKRLVGVVCRGCGWRGYRVALITTDTTNRLDLANATVAIKGMKSHPSCPHCGTYCVATHVTPRTPQ